MGRSGSVDHARADDIPVLPDDVPVTMPELPARLVITSGEQFKAIAEPTRSRILGIIQLQPATAKQIADRLHVAHGAVGHHLQVLEAAGLAQVVARRLVRGIVAKYYARTARIFAYALSPDVTGGMSPSLEIVTKATHEFAETVVEGGGDDRAREVSFPRARISAARTKMYQDRLGAILDEFLREPDDPTGEVYSCLVALFRSPDYLQGQGQSPSPATDAETGRETGGGIDQRRAKGSDA